MPSERCLGPTNALPQLFAACGAGTLRPHTLRASQVLLAAALAFRGAAGTPGVRPRRRRQTRHLPASCERPKVSSASTRTSWAHDRRTLRCSRGRTELPAHGTVAFALPACISHLSACAGAVTAGPDRQNRCVPVVGVERLPTKRPASTFLRPHEQETQPTSNEGRRTPTRALARHSTSC